MMSLVFYLHFFLHSTRAADFSQIAKSKRDVMRGERREIGVQLQHLPEPSCHSTLGEQNTARRVRRLSSRQGRRFWSRPGRRFGVGGGKGSEGGKASSGGESDCVRVEIDVGRLA